METADIIKQIEKFQAQLLVNTGNGVEINNPTVVSEVIVKIRILLVQLVDHVADAELSFKQTRAAKYDELIKKGEKRTPAEAMIKMDLDLIKMESDADRINKYMKYVDSLVSAVQSLLKVQSSAERNQY